MSLLRASKPNLATNPVRMQSMPGSLDPRIICLGRSGQGATQAGGTLSDAEYEALILELGKRVAVAMIEENCGYEYGQATVRWRVAAGWQS